MPRTKIQVLQEFLIQLPDLPIQKQIIQNIKSAEGKFQTQKKQFKNKYSFTNARYTDTIKPRTENIAFGATYKF